MKKILVISDIHGKPEVSRLIEEKIKSYKVNYVIVAGDITHFGPTDWAIEFLDRIPKPTLALPGNCDPKEIINKFSRSKAILLHNKKIRFENDIFVGFGGSNPTPFNTLLELSEAEIYKALAKIMERNCILVTHCPAKGVLDYMEGKGNLGSISIARVVKEYEPKLHISGHIHEARGIEYNGKTLCVNPGQASKGYAALVELTEKTIDVKLL
jgi:hypothetical protein